MKKFTVGALVALALSGCAETQMSTYVDPDFNNTEFSSFVVDTQGVSVRYKRLLDNALCDEIIEHGANCRIKSNVIPPTREYSPSQVKEIYISSGIDSLLVVYLGTEDQKSGYGGSITTFGAGSAISTPITYNSRSTDYQIRLYDVETERNAAAMTANTFAQGSANTSLSVFAESLAKKLADEMVLKGLLAGKASNPKYFNGHKVN